MPRALCARRRLLAPMNGNTVKWGLLMECAELKEEYRCRLEALDMFNAASKVLDTLHVLPEAGEKRKPFAQAAARAYASHFQSQEGRSGHAFPGHAQAQGPGQSGHAHPRPGHHPQGLHPEIPLGATLVIGDAPKLIVLTMENVHFILYPHSSYTYLLPKVVQLNSGTLGIIKGVDSASIEGKLRSATAHGSEQSDLENPDQGGRARQQQPHLAGPGQGHIPGQPEPHPQEPAEGDVHGHATIRFTRPWARSRPWTAATCCCAP